MTQTIAEFLKATARAGDRVMDGDTTYHVFSTNHSDSGGIEFGFQGYSSLCWWSLEKASSRMKQPSVWRRTDKKMKSDSIEEWCDERWRKIATYQPETKKIANHTPPKAIIAFCPDCLSYGTPKPSDDCECLNCRSKNLRVYQELEKTF